MTEANRKLVEEFLAAPRHDLRLVLNDEDHRELRQVMERTLPEVDVEYELRVDEILAFVRLQEATRKMTEFRRREALRR